jgi:hypothetical protein
MAGRGLVVGKLCGPLRVQPQALRNVLVRPRMRPQVQRRPDECPHQVQDQGKSTTTCLRSRHPRCDIPR